MSKKVNSKDAAVIKQAKKIVKEKFPDSTKQFVAEIIALLVVICTAGGAMYVILMEGLTK